MRIKCTMWSSQICQKVLQFHRFQFCRHLQNQGVDRYSLIQAELHCVGCF